MFPYAPISNSVPRTQFITGLNQAIYGTNWTANDASDIQVYLRGPNVPANDLLQLVPSSQYTVQFIGSNNIVQITFLNAYIPQQYNFLTITRNVPAQFINLYNNTNFTPSMLNGDFETLTMVDQQVEVYTQQITPRYNISDTINQPIDTILPVLGANQFWAKNSTNTAFVAVTLADAGGGGEFPVNGPFVLTHPDSNYPSGFNLGALGNGLLAQTISLGVSTPFVIPFPLNVADGGTGITSYRPFSVFIGGVNPTDPFGQVANLGALGQVLTSSGPALPPSWQNLPSVQAQVSTVAFTSPVSLVSATSKTLTSLTLPTGDWVLTGNVFFLDNTPNFTVGACGINTVNNTLGALGTYAIGPGLTGSNLGLVAPSVSVTLSVTTTFYLVGTLGFTGTASMCGSLTAIPVFP